MGDSIKDLEHAHDAPNFARVSPAECEEPGKTLTKCYKLIYLANLSCFGEKRNVQTRHLESAECLDFP